MEKDTKHNQDFIKISKTRGERERQTRQNSSKEQKCSGTPRQTIFKVLQILFLVLFFLDVDELFYLLFLILRFFFTGFSNNLVKYKYTP